jgi:hypothetical protein
MWSERLPPAAARRATLRGVKAVAAAVPGATCLEINQLHPADHKLSRDGTGLAVEAVRRAPFIEFDENGLGKFGTSVSAILDHLSQYGYKTYWLTRVRPHQKASAAEIHASVARNGDVDVLVLEAG